MPIYEYACSACDQIVEIIHGVSAAAPVRHDGCGGELRRVASASTTRVKGSSGLKDSTHTPSMFRFHENRTLAAEKKLKKC